MSTSFFKKFTPEGSTPIVSQKRIVKITSQDKFGHHRDEKLSATSPHPQRTAAPPPQSSSPPGHPRRLKQKTLPQKQPRRIVPGVTLAIPTENNARHYCHRNDQRPPNSAGSSPSQSSPLISVPLEDPYDSLRLSLKPKRSLGEKRGLLEPPSPESLGSRGRGQSAASSQSPTNFTRLSSSDDDDNGSEDERERKRPKIVGSSPLPSGCVRKIVHPLSFHTRDPNTGEPVKRCNFVHAEQIANTEIDNWSRRKAFRRRDIPLRVGLHYPGIPDQERFQVVQNSDPDEFDPVAEIITTMEQVAHHLVPPNIADEILSEVSGGLVYRLRRSLKHGDGQQFLDHIRSYNELVRQLRRDGTFKRNISAMMTIPFPLVEHILMQSYARTVALEVEGLKDYQAFSNEVYGELLPKFTAKIFKEASLTADKVFVDLGSGTGNVVLHAALEIGCESWGCEKMDKPARLAKRQRAEFIARCRMWGIHHGDVHLEHDTFLENRKIAETLKRADVLLVNNFAFEPDLNQKLLDMFLDLKEGTQIISLKPFVTANHVITTRNAENPVNRLRMVEKRYYSSEVSWTDSGGSYYVHTVDGGMLREFMEKEQRMKRKAVVG